MVFDVCFLAASTEVFVNKGCRQACLDFELIGFLREANMREKCSFF